jgi:hypothetical protein
MQKNREPSDFDYVLPGVKRRIESHNGNEGWSYGLRVRLDRVQSSYENILKGTYAAMAGMAYRIDYSIMPHICVKINTGLSERSYDGETYSWFIHPTKLNFEHITFFEYYLNGKREEDMIKIPDLAKRTNPYIEIEISNVKGVSQTANAICIVEDIFHELKEKYEEGSLARFKRD